MAKSERIFGEAQLLDDSQGTVSASFDMALADLAVKATHEGREVIWGTLETSVERQFEDVQRVMDAFPARNQTAMRINVSAIGVKRG